MITEIKMENLACYKNATRLKTDKRINLVYGLNGTGKSTISNYLANPNNIDATSCQISMTEDVETLVYNHSFIREVFYENDSIPGVFTLSKANKEAEEKIKATQKEAEEIIAAMNKLRENEKEIAVDTASKRLKIENKTWEIKQNYTGGDRVLEFCLTGLMGKKEALFKHILSVPFPDKKPSKSIDDLKKEALALTDSNSKAIPEFPQILFPGNSLEEETIFQKEIVGNQNSSIAELIQTMGSSDWVKAGLKFIPENGTEKTTTCPFCQEKTITKEFVSQIEAFFDEAYERDLETLRKYLALYSTQIQQLPKKEMFESNPLIAEKRVDFEVRHKGLVDLVTANLAKIQLKIQNPSQKISLDSSVSAIKTLNSFLAQINIEAAVINERLKNRDKALAEIRTDFWRILRCQYEPFISAYLAEEKSLDSKLKFVLAEIKIKEKALSEKNAIIIDQQKKVVNIDEAIGNINSTLISLGIETFKIVKHSESLYRVSRSTPSENTFRTLSEGEKMIISFLYFRELARGKRGPADVPKKRVVVIDDPISSLSHIFVFNVGELIKRDFFNSSNFSQVFLFTHSLYFFYEMTDIKKERRESNQNLFRLSNGPTGSQISPMKYEEVQNDYHSYWQVILDKNHSPALIANCMRNIVEYFFSFIEKRDLNNVFQKPSLQANRFQAFYRFINRESHSLGQNIYDYKEFNYDDFKDGLKLVFTESGYQEHFQSMTSKFGT